MKNKKQDPMPPPDATPEEVGEFWDTHSLADYWDETHEVEVQVNLKPRQDLSSDEDGAADQNDTLSAKQGWRKLKDLIQSLDKQHEGRKKGEPFEELVAKLLGLLLEDCFEIEKSGYQPRGDAINEERTIVLQTKNYNDETPLDRKEILGDIEEAELELPNLQVYVLAASRTINNRLRNRFGDIEKKTGLDIVSVELSDELSDLGALCVTYWEDIHHFFDLSDMDPQFSVWVQIARDDSKTQAQMERVQSKLEYGIQTQKHVQKDIEKYLLKHFSRDQGFNPINLSEAVERESLESKIMDWWDTEEAPICCLEGKEGYGKTWLASKWMNSIREKENIVTFWLDSKDWCDHKTIFDLLYTCFSLIYPSYEQRKIAKLQSKSAKIWRKTLIVLDGVNEWNAIEAAQRILTEYYNPNSEWTDRIRFLFTIRSLDNYRDFENYLPEDCHKISVEPFNDSELQEALTRKGLQLSDLPNSLIETAKIPRYLERCIELRNELGSFGVVTKEMVLLADLSDKIKHSDPQIKQKLGWIRPEDPKDFFSHLAKQIEWNKIDDAPKRLGHLLKECLDDYSKIRLDLEEQGIVSETRPFDAKLSADHVLLCWALYLSSLFESVEFTKIEDLLERFQQELEPIPQEDVSTEALFAALQLSAISPNTNLSQEQRSQKRAALMLAWFRSHNAQITDERLLFWAQEDTDAYAQVVEFEFEHHNSPNYEETLIELLAKTWLNKKGNLNRLASRLTKWLLPAHGDSALKEIVYIQHEGDQFAVKKYDIQLRWLNAALSILSQRPERQFLKTLARCYAILHSNATVDDNFNRHTRFFEKIGKLMRWGYTDEVLGDLHWLVELAQPDELLLRGVYGLADCLRMDLPLRLQRPLSEKELETRAFVNRICHPERILTGDSPEENANRRYYSLDCLAVRKDLSPWCNEDQNEIKRISRYVSVNPEKGVNKDLIPWIAKYDPEGYRELSCNLKINALNPEYPLYDLGVTQELIFEPNDCKRITEAILEMKECLLQGNDSSCEYADLLTEILLFSASEDRLIDWFEFLALHEPLRGSICYKPLLYLLGWFLPKSIVELAQQRLEKLRSSVSDNQPLSNDESQEFSEEEFWCALYAYGTPVDENSVKFALGELKLRKPNSTGTYPMLRLALSNSKQFLDEMLNDERIQEHLFSKNGRRFIVPPYDQGEAVIAYDKLMSSLPQEIVGSFLYSLDQRDDLARWGRELITRMCSILQGVEGDSNSVEEKRIEVNSDALRTWAEQDTTNFLQLAKEYLTELSKFPRYDRALSHFTDDIRCLLLRLQPDKAKQHYYQWNSEIFKIVYRTRYGVPTLLAQLWKVEYCNSPEHRQLRRELLEECLNDEGIMFMTLAALAEDGRDELWSLVENEYLESHYAKERNLGVSILPWFGTNEAIKKLKELKSDDKSLWVREHAAWAYEVAQQERSCREVYREVLQTHDPFKISAVFEQIKPALSPAARWWCEIEHKKFREESQDIDPKLAALVDRFWYRWRNSSKTKRNIEVFRRRLREYCRGEKISAGSPPRIAPWWKLSSD